MRRPVGRNTAALRTSSCNSQGGDDMGLLNSFPSGRGSSRTRDPRGDDGWPVELSAGRGLLDPASFLPAGRRSQAPSSDVTVPVVRYADMRQSRRVGASPAPGSGAGQRRQIQTPMGFPIDGPCPADSRLICTVEAPPISIPPGAPEFQPGYNFGGVGYGPNDPDNPKSPEAKWQRYDCLARGGKSCSFVAPSRDDLGYGIVTRPSSKGPMPTTAGQFVVDPRHPSDLAAEFWKALKKNYQKAPR